ncbi:MAG: hypothetical protein J6A59_14140 [Lachnospiraceae bacterium]|nr:hypothetical protein [Lachnospiraceae bacterium]
MSNMCVQLNNDRVDKIIIKNLESFDRTFDIVIDLEKDSLLDCYGKVKEIYSSKLLLEIFKYEAEIEIGCWSFDCGNGVEISGNFRNILKGFVISDYSNVVMVVNDKELDLASIVGLIKLSYGNKDLKKIDSIFSNLDISFMENSIVEKIIVNIKK